MNLFGQNQNRGFQPPQNQNRGFQFVQNFAGFGTNQPQNHISFIPASGQAFGFSATPFNFGLSTSNKSISLSNKKNGFNILEIMPKNFEITTNSGSSFFNVEFIRDSSSVIDDFLRDNPKHFQYHLKINDENNVLRKFEQMFQGKTVHFTEEDIPTYQLIIDTLKIARCPNYKKPEQPQPQPQVSTFNFSFPTDNVKQGAKINENIIDQFFRTTDSLLSFTIKTNKKEYKCNVFGILASKVLYDLVTKEPTADRYEYNFDDEFGEFQAICDIFNFKVVRITPDNMNTIKEIAEELQITYIIKNIDEIIAEYEKISDKIDEQQSNVEVIDNLFDLLYNIKEKTVESVRDSIIESDWSKTIEDVQELAAFILQVVKTDFTLHRYLVDLLEQLDQNANETNSLKILIPSIIKQLMVSFSRTKTNCSFIYNLFKKGFIKKEEIIRKIKIKPPGSLDEVRSNENIYTWFLPELIETHIFNENFVLNNNNTYSTFGSFGNAQFFQNAQVNQGFNLNPNPNNSQPVNEITTYQSFIKLFYPNNIDAYKKMRDEGEPHDKLTKALRNDDVDTVQSILSRSTDDQTKQVIPYNMYEEFVPNGSTKYIDYAAAYGSLKCFKFLLLNHHEINENTFRFAVFGGNTEIIQTVDKAKINQPAPQPNTFTLNTAYQSMNWKTMPSVQKHQYKIFDWIIENKFKSQDKTDSNLFDLFINCVSNGNAHAMIGVIDCGFDITKDESNSKSLIQLAAQNGFYKVAKLLYDLTIKKRSSSFALQPLTFNFGTQQSTSSFNFSTSLTSVYLQPISIDNFVSFGNLNIFKLGCNLFTIPNDRERALATAVRKDFRTIVDFYFDKLVKSSPNHVTFDGIKNALNNSVCRSSCDLFDYLMDKYEKSNTKTFQDFKGYFTILTTACSFRNFEATKKLIKLCLEANPKEDLSTPFIKAAASGSTQICQYFIDQNLTIDYDQLSNNVFDLCSVSKFLFTLVVDRARPSLRDKFLFCSLTPAIQKKNIELIDYLLSRKVPYDNILFDAVQTHDVKTVDVILKYNSRPSFVNRKTENGSALFIATKNNDISIIKRLLKVPGIELNVVDQRNYSIMMYVCETNKRDALKEFLNSGLADTNTSSPQNGNSLLMQSIAVGNNEVAELLIKYDKTDINAQNYQGQTALTIAANRNALSIIDLLINNPKFNAEDSRLNYAFYISTGEVSNHLIQAKDIDVNYRNVPRNNNIPGSFGTPFSTNINYDVYDTPIMHAVDTNNINIIDLIVNHPSFDKERSRNDSAILISIQRNSPQMFNKLIDLDGRDINEIKFQKAGVYASAIFYKSFKIISELLNNPKITITKDDILMTFTNLFGSPESANSSPDLINKLLDYCEEHEGLIDFTKTLPDRRSFFTSIRPKIDNIENIVNFLVKMGANPNEPDEFGTYPLEHAIKTNYYDYVVALLNLNKIDYNQKIPTVKKNFLGAQLINYPIPVSGFSNANFQPTAGRSIFGSTSTGFNFYYPTTASGSTFGSFGSTLTVSNLQKQKDNESENKKDENSEKSKEGSEKKEDNENSTEKPKEESEKKEDNVNSTEKPKEESEKKEDNVSFTEKNKEESEKKESNINTTAPFTFNFTPNASQGPSFNFNIITKDNYKTYLHLAAASNNSDILMEFINRRLIDINITDNEGNTPLIDACKCRMRENIESILLVDNVDFLHKNKNGCDALKFVKQVQNIFGSSFSFGTPSNTESTKVENKKSDDEIKDKDEYTKKILSYINPQPGFVFGPNTNTTGTTGFTFGNSNTNTNTTGTTGFTFNYKTPNTNNNESKPATSFSFGNSNTNNNESKPAAAFSFGNSNTNNDNESKPAGAFSFGSSTTNNNSSKQPSFGFNLSPSSNNNNSDTKQPSFGFSFGQASHSNQILADKKPKNYEEKAKIILDIFKDSTPEEVSKLKKEILGITERSEQKESDEKEEKREDKRKIQKQRENKLKFALDDNDDEENELSSMSPYDAQEMMMQQQWQHVMQMNYIRQVNFERQMMRNANLIQNICQNQSSKKKKKKHHKK